MGKGAGKKTAYMFIPQYASYVKDLWDALGPVWNTLNSLWDKVGSLWSKVSSAVSQLRSWVKDFYDDIIKPVWNKVEVAWSKINDVLDWIDDLYHKTIGKIDEVYNKLFGKIEKVWRDFEDTRDKVLRLISTFNKDLSQKIYDATEKVEASTIGRIRDLRDELLHKIDKVYEELRSRINDFYYAIKDIVDQANEVVFRIKDVIDISFEKPNVLSKETIIRSADTYGADWFESLMMQGTEPTRIRHVEVMFRQETAKEMDRIIDEIRAGKKGPWGDVASYIDDAVFRVASGLDPAPWDINLDEVEDPYHAFLEPFKNLPKTEEGWAKVMEEIIEEKYDKEV